MHPQPRWSAFAVLFVFWREILYLKTYSMQRFSKSDKRTEDNNAHGRDGNSVVRRQENRVECRSGICIVSSSYVLQ